MKTRFLLAGIAVAMGLSAAPLAYAMTPTFSLTGVGTDSVQVNVAGDPNSSAVLFYNVGSATGAQVSILGTTDSSGQIAKAVSVSALNLNTSYQVYVVVNSQQSATQSWVNGSGTTPSPSPSPTPSGSTGAVTFSQNNPTVSVGGSISITLSGGSSFYVLSNSNLGLTSHILNGNIITINGTAAGSTVLTVCNTEASCSPLTVTVGTATTTGATQAVVFNPANPTVAVGQSINVTLTGVSSFFLSTNSNSGAVSASVSGHTLSITGLAQGSATLTVCGTTGGCGTVNVTVTGTAVVTPTPTPIYSPSASPTPVAVTTATSGSVLTTIATMQNQLAQLLAAIQAMQLQLTQLVNSVKASTPTTAYVAPTTATVSSAPFSDTFTSFLSAGSTGAEVTALQKILIKEGFLTGSATGYFGSATEAAVKQYQEAHGLTAAGYVGPSTRAALNGQ